MTSGDDELRKNEVFDPLNGWVFADCCPFCGSAYPVVERSDSVKLKCSNCGATGPGWDYREERAVPSWNDRFHPTPALRWTGEHGHCEYAHSGSLHVASIGQLADDPSTWWYTVDAVSTKWIVKGRGHVRSRASARRAVQRAWTKWCTVAGLVAKETVG